MARDATARLYDVDADSIVLDKKTGTIAFRAKKGRGVALDQLHESIRATRLGDNTGMELRWLDVKVEGAVAVAGAEVKVTAPGSAQVFLLGEESAAPTAKEKAAFGRLREALQRGDKVVSVTGRVEGWKGNLTRFSKQLPAGPRRLLVKDFQTARP